MSKIKQLPPTKEEEIELLISRACGDVYGLLTDFGVSGSRKIKIMDAMAKLHANVRKKLKEQK